MSPLVIACTLGGRVELLVFGVESVPGNVESFLVFRGSVRAGFGGGFAG